MLTIFQVLMIFKAKILQKNRKSLSFRKYNFYKCDQGSDLWQQLELASELESDLRGTVDWDRKWLVDFNAGKKSTSFVSPV